MPADRGHEGWIAVRERRRFFLAKPALNYGRDVPAGLPSNRRQLRADGAVELGACRHIAHDEHIRSVRYAEVGLYHDSAPPRLLEAEEVRKRIRSDAYGPERGMRSDELATSQVYGLRRDTHDAFIQSIKSPA
ncbi:MAG: hypothetical protein SH809_11315 [Rhodothermales bacterium]|nr:hypothetical protein [Rhodothermales bacterium]